MRRILWLLAAGLIISQTTHAQVLSTVAGSGEPGFCGDGGPALTACLAQPVDVAVDSAGNLFILEAGNFFNHYGNRRVRKVDTSGTISTVVGGGSAEFCGDNGPAIEACLDNPGGLAVDAAGNLFIADTGNHRIRKVDVTGTITTVAGVGWVDGFGAFCGDLGPATSACLNEPNDVIVDAAGNLFIADTFNHRVRKVSPSGIISTVAGSGAYLFCGDGGPATSACLDHPQGVAVDAAGNLFIADLFNGRVRKVDAAGTISTVAGGNLRKTYCGDGGDAIDACVHAGRVAVNAAGTLFIGDYGRVRMVSAGKITTVAGIGGGTGSYCADGPATATCLGNADMTFDSEGRLIVADWGNSRIRVLEFVPPTIKLKATLVTGCVATTGKVELSSPAPPGGRLVTFESDDFKVTVPPRVTVNAGAWGAQFPITTSPVASLETATIQATSLEATGPGAALALKPIPPLSVVFSPASVVGGQLATGTITLPCAAGPGDIVATLSTTNRAIAAPTAPTVTIPAGATSATFTVATAPVAVSKTPKISVTINGVTKLGALTVKPVE